MEGTARRVESIDTSLQFQAISNYWIYGRWVTDPLFSKSALFKIRFLVEFGVSVNGRQRSDLAVANVFVALDATERDFCVSQRGGIEIVVASRFGKLIDISFEEEALLGVFGGIEKNPIRLLTEGSQLASVNLD
jgi:hypothetical protein